MSLKAGTKLGHFEIQSALGAGGMGEVYRAIDTRLNRTVAVKVLPSHLSANTDLKQRFEREARAVSSLNHPHICTLHDIGHQNGIDYLVMEFLEGETLAEKLTKGALPIEQTVRYGIQIADALHNAHKQGIVHRDLKPGNIMLTKSGAKLLDFGLAKFEAAAQLKSDSLSELATEERELTAEGTIMGTFQYMSPEQLEEGRADTRTDIFALGAVLYEMATGKKAFIGKSRASLITAIMSAEPHPISSIQPLTPRALERLIKICLAKDPDLRWQTAHDVMLELQGILESISQPEASATAMVSHRSFQKLPWVLTALGALAAAAFAVAYFSKSLPQHQKSAIQLSIHPPDPSAFFTGTGPVAISPDGKYVAFNNNADGRRTLWLRPLKEPEARQLPGTEHSTNPFWSPDSRYIAFFARGKLMKISISGGRPQVLCDASRNRGGFWGNSNIIIFADQPNGPLYQVPADGGKPKQVTELDQSAGELTHRFPVFLPDGRHFLYLIRFTKKNQGIYSGSLDSSEKRFVLDSGSRVSYAPPGYLLYLKDFAMLAQSFDPQSLRIQGEAFPIAKRGRMSATGQSAISVSDNGVIAYWPGQLSDVEFLWYGRNGVQQGQVGELENSVDSRFHRLSPDGTQVAWLRGDPDALTPDVWVTDISRNVSTRLTYRPEFDETPVWSPDGKSVVYCRATLTNTPNILLMSSTGAGEEQVLLKESLYLSDWSSDGKFIAGYRYGKRNDIWVMNFLEKKISPYLQTEFDEFQASFSPDGGWIAYTSDESGDYEVYVQSFPVSGKKWRISADGGAQPRWRRDGKELFYLSLDRKVVAVEVNGNAGNFVAGVPRVLFKAPITASTFYPYGSDYDVTADGQRFLVSSSTATAQSSPPINVILNWTDLIRTPR